jgi:hypothetical protein
MSESSPINLIINLSPSPIEENTMKKTLITTLTLSLTLPAHAMEEPALTQQINYARSEIASARALADEKSKEKDLSIEDKGKIENAKFALEIFSAQTRCVETLYRVVQAIEKKAQMEKEEASKVRVNGSTQVIMDDEKEDGFVVVSDPKPADLTRDDKVTTLK